MNPILTFKKKLLEKKKKKKPFVTFGFKVEKSWPLPPRTTCSQKCWAHVWVGTSFALFDESDLDFSKKKNFRHCWVHIWEILVISLSDSVLAEMLSTPSDWNVICSLWWIWYWLSKKNPKKKKPFVTFGFKVEKSWPLPSRTLCSQKCWARLRVGTSFALFGESDLDFSKKKNLPSLLGPHLRNSGYFPFGLCARRNVEHVFGLECHLLSFMNPTLTFQKSHLVSIPRMRFTTSVPSGASTPFGVYCIRDRHICTPNLISFYLEWASLLGDLN